GRELLWMYPMCLAFAAGAAAGGWYFYRWAAGAGALRDAKIFGCLAVVALFGLGLLVVPLLWPLRLRRSRYALTTQPLLVRVPAVLAFWPRVREVAAARAGGVRLKCVWAWLPEGTGDIYYGPGPMDFMERVPGAEEVVALIRSTLLQPQGQPQPGEGDTA